MSEAITWSLSLSSQLLKDLVDEILNQLKNYSKGIIRTKISQNERTAKARDEILALLRSINYVIIINPSDNVKSQIFTITDNGREYIRKTTEDEKQKQFHYDLQNIFWYDFAFRKLINMQNEIINREQFMEIVSRDSESEFLVNRFDKHTFDNVINCLQFNKVIEKKGKEYIINKEFQNQFDEKLFLHEVEKIFEVGEKRYTVEVCTKLVQNRHHFISAKNIIQSFNVIEALNRLLEYENERIKFMGGMPKPPIPAKYTIVERLR